jgi:hypothetical protein
MSRLRHEKSRQRPLAGAGSGVHRLEVDKPHPFKPDEELKHGGRAKRAHGGGCTKEMDGSTCHSKLGRKRGGACHAKGGHVGQDGKPSNHGTDAFPDRGSKLGTKLHEDKMSGHGNIEDSLKDGGKVKWIQSAIKPEHKGMEKRAAHKAGESTHEYMESHKHDSGKSGSRARLGLRLSAMSKHKD